MKTKCKNILNIFFNTMNINKVVKFKIKNQQQYGYWVWVLNF